MRHQASSQNIVERPSAIVCIAYHQLSLMTGIKDPTTRPIMEKNQIARDDDCNYMVCTRRLFSLPLFVSVTTTFSNAYATVKRSHDSVESILNSAENRLNEGVEYASPYTRKVAAALETPLKAVDNVICVSLDFFEQKLPTIKILPEDFYAKINDGFRYTTEKFDSIMVLIENLTNQVSVEVDGLKKLQSNSNNASAND